LYNSDSCSFFNSSYIFFKTHAVVTMDCDRSEAEEAIKALDRNFWMDNSIRVMFNNRNKTALKPDQADLNGGDADDGVNENIHPDKNNSADSSKAELNDSETGFEDPPAEVCKDEKKIKERTLLVFCNTKSKTFLADMTNVVFQKYGTVKSAEWQSYRDADHQVLSIVMYSSELDAVRCIHDTNNISYKGQSLRVKFEEGSVENSLPFRGQYLNSTSDLKPRRVWSIARYFGFDLHHRKRSSSVTTRRN